MRGLLLLILNMPVLRSRYRTRVSAQRESAKKMKICQTLPALHSEIRWIVSRAKGRRDEVCRRLDDSPVSIHDPALSGSMLWTKVPLGGVISQFLCFYSNVFPVWSTENHEKVTYLI